MAIEQVPNRNQLFQTRPLLDCLRRLRNVVVHHKPLQVTKDEFVGRLVDPADPSFGGIQVTQTEAWYLAVSRPDLDMSRPGPIDADTADWFIRQCDRWPLTHLLIVATNELCGLYAPSATR
jgi:hypothetical protein